MKKKVLESNGFKLKFYSGFKGRETPRSLVIGNREFKIDRVLERKRILDDQTGEKSESFICVMEGQRVRLTIHDSGKFQIDYLPS